MMCINPFPPRCDLLLYGEKSLVRGRNPAVELRPQPLRGLLLRVRNLINRRLAHSDFRGGAKTLGGVSNRLPTPQLLERRFPVNYEVCIVCNKKRWTFQQSGAGPICSPLCLRHHLSERSPDVRKPLLSPTADYPDEEDLAEAFVAVDGVAGWGL